MGLDVQALRTRQFPLWPCVAAFPGSSAPDTQSAPEILDPPVDTGPFRESWPCFIAPVPKTSTLIPIGVALGSPRQP